MQSLREGSSGGCHGGSPPKHDKVTLGAASSGERATRWGANFGELTPRGAGTAVPAIVLATGCLRGRPVAGTFARDNRTDAVGGVSFKEAVGGMGFVLSFTLEGVEAFGA